MYHLTNRWCTKGWNGPTANWSPEHRAQPSPWTHSSRVTLPGNGPPSGHVWLQITRVKTAAIFGRQVEAAERERGISGMSVGILKDMSHNASDITSCHTKSSIKPVSMQTWTCAAEDVGITGDCGNLGKSLQKESPKRFRTKLPSRMWKLNYLPTFAASSSGQRMTFLW